MISAVTETTVASIDEIKFHNYFFQKNTKFSKKIWPMTHFIVLLHFLETFQTNTKIIFKNFQENFAFVPNDYSRKVDVLLTTSRIISNHDCIIER